MSDRERLPWQEDNPRRAAINFLIRYWGLEAMQRQRMLISVPLLPDGEEESEEHGE